MGTLTAPMTLEPSRSFSFKPAVSVVIPTLNHANMLQTALPQLHRVLSAVGIPYEALIVDMGSTDALAPVISRLIDEGLPLLLLTPARVSTRAAALIEGFTAARFAVFVTLDAELRYPFAALPQLIAKLDQADLVIGDRQAGQEVDPQLRGLLRDIYEAAIQRGILGTALDVQSGMKVFTRALFSQVAIDLTTRSFDIDLTAQALRVGASVASVPIVYIGRAPQALSGMPLLWHAAQVKAQLLLSPRALPPLEVVYALPSEPVMAEPQAPEPIANRYRATLTAAAPPEPERAIVADYRARSLRPIVWKGKRIQPFAPYDPQRSASETITREQRLLIMLAVFLWALTLAIFGAPVLVTTLAVITLLYLTDLVLNVVLATRTLSIDPLPPIDEVAIRALDEAIWPRYTILCPLYKEVEVVPQFVRAMSALDYPAAQLQILFLTEENDAETRDAILAMGLPKHFSVITVPDGEPRTKPRACNYGLLETTGDFVVIYDAEDMPEPLQLKKAVLTFAQEPEDVACIQARLNFYNPGQNLLTRWFAIEYTLWFDLILPGMERARIPLPLGGTSNHFRTKLLRAVGAWDPFNVTEDCDLGLRLGANRLRTVMLDSTTYEEANSHVGNWLRQRSRWIKGYMQTYLVHMRQPMSYLREKRLGDFLWLQVLIGGRSATLLLNPLMWLLLAIYIGLRPFVESSYHTLFPAPVFYMGTFCLIFGNFFYTYLYLAACARSNSYGLIKWAIFMPIYWALMSSAAVIALKELIFSPHYWAKTRHGLHLSAMARGAIPTISAVGERLAQISQTGMHAIVHPDSSPGTVPVTK